MKWTTFVCFMWVWVCVFFWRKTNWLHFMIEHPLTFTRYIDTIESMNSNFESIFYVVYICLSAFFSTSTFLYWNEQILSSIREIELKTWNTSMGNVSFIYEIYIFIFHHRLIFKLLFMLTNYLEFGVKSNPFE